MFTILRQFSFYFFQDEKFRNIFFTVSKKKEQRLDLIKQNWPKKRGEISLEISTESHSDVPDWHEFLQNNPSDVKL